MFIFIGCTALSAILEGGGGIVAVELEDSISATDETITVTETTDFLDTDYIMIGNEQILYSGKTSTTFTGCTRGYSGTTADSHEIGDIVYTRQTNIVNNALAFSVAATIESEGAWAVIAIPWNFFTKTLPNVAIMNYSFLTGDMAFVGWIYLAITAGLIIVLALAIAGGRRVI